VKITPLDIRRKEFKRSVRGYLDEEVDVFLDAVGNEFELLAQENTGLQERVQALEEQAAGHAKMREALEKTLVAAQLQSDEIRSKAQKESQSILQEAETKAKGVVDDLYSQMQRAQQTLVQLKLLEEDFRFKFRALLEGYLKLVEEGPILLSVLQPDAKVVASAEAAGGGGSEGESVPLTDDGPTSETQEVAILGLGDEEVEPAKTNAASGTEVAEQVPAAGAPRNLDDTTEDFTVETRSLPADAGVEAGVGPGKSEEQEKDGGVFFGRLEEDPDDPFPGMGGKPSKARDFEW
jgi:cell division initiation protein